VLGRRGLRVKLDSLALQGFGFGRIRLSGANGFALEVRIRGLIIEFKI
jgi:hypothetical protein